MATNIIPMTYDPLVALAEDAADGAQQHEAAIGLLQNKEAAIRTDRTALTGAETNVLAKRAAKSAAIATLRTADSNGKAFIALFVRTGKTTIGSDWNATWEQAGFTAGSLAIPETPDVRFTLIDTLRNFLGTNAQYEVTNQSHPELSVTNAIANTHFNAISDARSAANLASTLNGAALATRDAAKAALRHRLTGLREELGQLLADDDPRWYSFGFNRPADPETPGVPDGLVVTQGVAGSGTLIVDWNDSRRSTGYKVFALATGATDPVEFGLFEDSQAVITFPAGTAVQITILAHNNHGYSAESTPVNATAP